MIAKVLKIIMGIIAAFIIFVIISQSLIFIGPFIGGVIVMTLSLEPNPRLAVNMESIGNIFVLIISVYAGYITYKKIVGKLKKDTEVDNL